jgi:CHASE2 domain-containing sensor protein
MTASRVLELTKRNALAQDNILAGKVVLLGGTYLGQDLHDTPIGPLSGVEILAQVVETELQGGGDKSPPKLTIFVLEIFEGILVIILFQLFHVFPFVKALALNLVIFLIIASICSFITFGSFLRLVGFFPLLGLILLFEFLFECRTHIVKDWPKTVREALTRGT